MGSRPCLEASENHGFTIDEAEVIYWGSCAVCKKAARGNHGA
jgi:Fe2+ or Zn2+ uptake regulation protein